MKTEEYPNVQKNPDVRPMRCGTCLLALEQCRQLMYAGRVNERLKKLAEYLNLESEKLTSLLARKTGCRSLLRKGREEHGVLHSRRWNFENLRPGRDGQRRASTRTYDTIIRLITPDV